MSIRKRDGYLQNVMEGTEDQWNEDYTIWGEKIGDIEIMDDGKWKFIYWKSDKPDIVRDREDQLWEELYRLGLNE